MKSFKEFLAEQEDNTVLQSNFVKEINKELFKLTQKNDKSSDISEMFNAIQDVLTKFNIVMVSDNLTEFKPQVIINKKEAFITISNVKSIDANNKYVPYDNVVLNVEWNIFDGEYALKNANLKEKK